MNGACWHFYSIPFDVSSEIHMWILQTQIYWCKSIDSVCKFIADIAYNTHTHTSNEIFCIKHLIFISLKTHFFHIFFAVRFLLAHWWQKMRKNMRQVCDFNDRICEILRVKDTHILTAFIHCEYSFWFMHFNILRTRFSA